MDMSLLQVIGREEEGTLFTEGAVLPEQFYAAPWTSAAKRPEALLMRAVLEEALTCFQAQFFTSSKRGLRLAREAEAWFASDATA